MSRFFPNFVTEKSENRDVTLFGSIQNAKIPAPTPSLSLMSHFCFCECVRFVLVPLFAAPSQPRPSAPPRARPPGPLLGHDVLPSPAHSTDPCPRRLPDAPTLLKVNLHVL